MAKKQDTYYFDTFIACVDCACQAAQVLDAALKNYHPEDLKTRLDAVHKAEHAADMHKHELMNTLAKAFITPIEREDIILLSQNIDDMVDKIEDVLMRLYCNNVRSIRPDALPIAQLLVRCCSEVKGLMAEFPNFKRSKTLGERIVAINAIEEEADNLFIKALRTLHTTSTDPLEIISWHEVYSYLEKCIDACEHVSDTVETVIMKNT